MHDFWSVARSVGCSTQITTDLRLIFHLFVNNEVFILSVFNC